MQVSTVIPSLSPDATFAERQKYRRVILQLPGPVDRWLTTNSRSPRINFLQDYLMLGDIKTEYVDCTVECVKVYLPLSCPRSALNFSYRMAIMVLDNLASTSCISQHVHRRVILERFVGPFDALDALDALDELDALDIIAA